MAKITKKSKRRLCVLTIVFLSLVISFACTVFKDWSQIMANTKESRELLKQYDTLLESEASLESEVTKLQDPEYMARYAREKYLYSKEGEIIVKMPKVTE